MSGKKRPRTKEVSVEPSETAAEGEESTWECTVCTYRNRYEAFKCEMCDTRKGTSTRKPRLNQDIQQMHSAVHNLVLHQHQKLPGTSAVRKQQTQSRREMEHADSPSTSRHSPESTSSGSLPKMSSNSSSGNLRRRKPIPIPENLIFRSSPKKFIVRNTKGDITTITEFRPKPIALNEGKSKAESVAA